MLKGLALSRTVMSLLEIGRHPTTLVTISLCTRKPTPCSCLSSFPLKYTVTPICWDFSRLFPSHLTQSKDAPLVSAQLHTKPWSALKLNTHSQYGALSLKPTRIRLKWSKEGPCAGSTATILHMPVCATCSLG